MNKPNQLSIHTMQDDLASTKAPSRFDLRHKRPLPKSKDMADLRTPIKGSEPKIPFKATKRHPKLHSPPPKNNYFATPPVLWTLGIILTIILFVIIFAIIAAL